MLTLVKIMVLESSVTMRYIEVAVKDVDKEIIPIEMDFTHTRGELSRPVAGALRYRNRQHGRV